MKKALAVFMAVLLTLSTLTAAVFAAPVEETTAAIEVATTVEEKTTRNIMNEDGLVVPESLNQLKNSVIFKIIEKIFKFILSIFGVKGPEIDQEGATIVDEIGSALDERLTHIFG